MSGRNLHKGSPQWVRNSLDNAKSLASDKANMMAWIHARLLQLGSFNEGYAVRALDLAATFPAYGDDGAGVIEEGNDDGLAEAAITYLEGLGFDVSSSAVDGTEESEKLRPVHDAGLPANGSSPVDDERD